MSRPTKYQDDFCQTAIDLMQQGASRTEVCAELDICYDTLLDWINKESPRFKPEFSESLKKGQQLSQSWWEKQGRINLENGKFNYTGWFMNMKNRFRKAPEKWADKVEQEIDQTININLIDRYES